MQYVLIIPSLRRYSHTLYRENIARPTGKLSHASSPCCTSSTRLANTERRSQDSSAMLESRRVTCLCEGERSEAKQGGFYPASPIVSPVRMSSPRGWSEIILCSVSEALGASFSSTIRSNSELQQMGTNFRGSSKKFRPLICSFRGRTRFSALNSLTSVEYSHAKDSRSKR